MINLTRQVAQAFSYCSYIKEKRNTQKNFYFNLNKAEKHAEIFLSITLTPYMTMFIV